jgi:hypothetical protein
MSVEARSETAVRRMSQVKIVEAPAGVRSQAASIPPGTRQTGAFWGINTFQSLQTLPNTAKMKREGCTGGEEAFMFVVSCHAQRMLPQPQGW